MDNLAIYLYKAPAKPYHTDRHIIAIYDDGDAMVTTWADEEAEGRLQNIIGWGYIDRPIKNLMNKDNQR